MKKMAVLGVDLRACCMNRQRALELVGLNGKVANEAGVFRKEGFAVPA